jgi:hypothetical protein
VGSGPPALQTFQAGFQRWRVSSGISAQPSRGDESLLLVPSHPLFNDGGAFPLKYPTELHSDIADSVDQGLFQRRRALRRKFQYCSEMVARYNRESQRSRQASFLPLANSAFQQKFIAHILFVLFRGLAKSAEPLRIAEVPKRSRLKFINRTFVCDIQLAYRPVNMLADFG